MVPFLKILDVYGAHSWEISVVGFIRKKKKNPELSSVIFTISHFHKQDVWLLPTLLALEAAYLDASELSNYLDNFEGTRVELFDTVVPQQLPALFQNFSQALAIVVVLRGI